MTLFERPAVAHFIAHLMQRGVNSGANRLNARARALLPQFPRHASELRVSTSYGEARAVLYKPSPDAAAPTIVYLNFHGSGFVLPITDLEDPTCRALCALSGAWVVNVDYVLAPQHPFPAAPRQAFELVQWAARTWPHARLVVGGQSAGGALAAAAARLAWEHRGPSIALQVLHYAPFDLTTPVRQKTSPLARPMLRPWMGDVFDTCYAPDKAARADRLLSPGGAADTVDLTGIAPAVIIACEHDILRAEAERYAQRLQRFGALAEYVELRGVDHGYDLKADALALESYARIAAHVRRVT